MILIWFAFFLVICAGTHLLFTWRSFEYLLWKNVCSGLWFFFLIELYLEIHLFDMFYYWILNFLYILYISPISHMWFANTIANPIPYIALHFCRWPCLKRLFNLILLTCLVFAFACLFVVVAFSLVVMSQKNNSQDQCSGVAVVLFLLRVLWCQIHYYCFWSILS